MNKFRASQAFFSSGIALLLAANVLLLLGIIDHLGATDAVNPIPVFIATAFGVLFVAAGLVYGSVWPALRQITDRFDSGEGA